MKPYVAVFGTVFAALTLAACDGGPVRQPAAEDAQHAHAAEVPANDASVLDKAGHALVNGAPAYATLYPEATLSKPVLNASEGRSAGGIAEFTTPASAEAVITHYRQLAEAEGLETVMEMNQGSARAIGARDGNGSELQVVASPLDEGITAVQLTWQDSSATF